MEEVRATAVKITVHLPDGDAMITAEAEEILLFALQQAGLSVVDAPCAGSGTCGKCRVRLKRAGAEEERLACRTRVEEDLAVWPQNGVQPQLAWTQELCLPVGEARSEWDGPAYGVAADIGTTTVAVYLFDLRTGCRRAHAGGASRRACGHAGPWRGEYGGAAPARRGDPGGSRPVDREK